MLNLWDYHIALDGGSDLYVTFVLSKSCSGGNLCMLGIWVKPGGCGEL